MKITNIDLYEYFGLTRPEEGRGYLTCYLQDTTWELWVNRRRPAVLIIPGGGYEFVSEREGEPVALHFLNAGYQAFVLNYSVKPHTFPIALRESAMAMACIRQNAAQMDVNANMVAAIGFSAGGHLCGTLGTMFDCPEVAELGDAALLRPDALGLCYPVTVANGPTHEGSFENLSGGDKQLRQRLSLDALVRSDMPPVYLWHVRDDDCVPLHGSIVLAQKLYDRNVDFVAHIFRRGGHGSSNSNAQVYNANAVPAFSKDVPGWLDSMIAYFTEIGLTITDMPK